MTKKIVNDLDYDGIEFPVQEKDFSKIETKYNTYINVLCYENKLVFPIFVSDQKFENSIDLLLITDGDKSHYCTSKILTDLCFTNQRIKTKNTFVKTVYNVLVVKVS